MILSIWKIVSLSSICAAISLPIIMAFALEDNLSISYMLISLIAMTLVLWRHRTNFIRLIKGEEPKIGTRS